MKDKKQIKEDKQQINSKLVDFKTVKSIILRHKNHKHWIKNWDQIIWHPKETPFKSKATERLNIIWWNKKSHGKKKSSEFQCIYSFQRK